MLSAMSFDHDNLIPVFTDFDDFESSPSVAAPSKPKRLEQRIFRDIPTLFHDLEEAEDVASLERFDVKASLGSGSYGRVYLVFDHETKQNLAMKVIRKRDILHRNAHSHLADELFISQLKIDCPFVNNAALVFEGPKHHFLVTELLEGGELYYLIRERGTLSEPETRFYAAELLVAIEALHKHGVLYRDLKPENILLHADGHVGLIDFGLSRPNFHSTDTTKTLCGTAEYVAPEMLVGDPYGFPIDAWGLGCVIFEMLTGSPPFFDSRQAVMNENIVFNCPKYPSHLSPCVVGLIDGLLNKHQKNRTTVEAAMRHPWFTGVNWEVVRKRALTPPYLPEAMKAVKMAALEKNTDRASAFSMDDQRQSFMHTP